MCEEAIDVQKCNACGGKCCEIYLSVEDGGMRGLQQWFDEYCDDWKSEFVASGALLRDAAGNITVNPAAGGHPLHDPLISHDGGQLGEECRRSLPEWVDIDRCQFCHPNTGCMLERRFRPRACREFICATGGLPQLTEGGA